MTDLTKSGVARRRWVTVVAAAVLFVCIPAFASQRASAAVTAPGDCRVDTPSRFHKQVVVAIRASGNLPMSWAASPNLARIVCWQGTGYKAGFLARGLQWQWHGMFAMTVQEMKMIAGPWMSNDPHELILDPTCFVRGWDACRHTTANTRRTQQLVAAMRWIWLIYGTPSRAWRNIVLTGRFDSYPRPGTDDTATKAPFSTCPVQGVVGYRDDFGMPRGTGGYHPHSGNDMHAPIGRPIRAPFDGLAVAHTDNWFAGKSVGLIGAKGFTRNAHLGRFGHLGYVHAGTVIGYVGQSGDALTPHDHFEWHPWVEAKPLHIAPTGFQRVLDAIDPYPFLNKVCVRG